MKTKTILICLLVMCLFFTTSSVLAQPGDPPPKKAEEPPREIQQTEPLQTEPNSPTLNPDYTPPPPPEKDNNDTNSRSTSGRNVSITNTFNIGAESGITERESDVAYGDGVYAIAYEKDGAIIVASLFKSGSSYLIYRDTVFDGDNSSHYPAIAYEAESGLFIVTWQYDYNGTGSDYDVYARLLDPYSGPVGSNFIVSETYDQETYPDVACKQSYSKCMVVFMRNDNSENIHGRYLGVGSSGISGPNAAFKITDLVRDEERPHIAWSFWEETYVIAYTWTEDDGDARPIRSILHDEWQGDINSTILEDETFAVYNVPGDAWYSDGHNIYAAGVTYDFCSEKIVFIYVYDWAGDGSDYDIHASAINGDGSSFISGPFYIATTSGQESSADISFITAPIPSIAYYAPSKLLTTYIRSDYAIGEGVMAATIEGNCDYVHPEYTTIGGSQHFLVDSPSLGFGSGVFAPSISGGGGTDFFISYDDVASGTVWQYDVLGALLRADLNNFLPLILR